MKPGSSGKGKAPLPPALTTQGARGSIEAPMMAALDSVKIAQEIADVISKFKKPSSSSVRSTTAELLKARLEEIRSGASSSKAKFKVASSLALEEAIADAINSTIGEKSSKKPSVSAMEAAISSAIEKAAKDSSSASSSAGSSSSVASVVTVILIKEDSPKSPKSDKVTKKNIDKYSDADLVALFDEGSRNPDKLLKMARGSKVVRISDDLVIKGGQQIRKSEARMLELAKNNDVSVPTVRRVFTMQRSYGGGAVKSDPAVYIVMDFIKGDNLRDVWEDLSDLQQIDVTDQLGHMIDTMQCVTTADGKLGPLGAPANVPWKASCFGSNGAGPFDKPSDIYDWMDSVHNKDLDNGRPLTETILLRGALLGPEDESPQYVQLRPRKKERRFEEPVMTHMAICRRNIIIRIKEVEDPKTGETTEEVRITLIGWSSSGMYPRRFEVLGMMNCIPPQTNDQEEGAFQVLSYGEDAVKLIYEDEVPGF